MKPVARHALPFTFIAVLLAAFTASAQSRISDAPDADDEELLKVHANLDGTPLEARVEFVADRDNGKSVRAPRIQVHSTLGAKITELADLDLRTDLPSGSDLDYAGGQALAAMFAVQSGWTVSQVDAVFRLACCHPMIIRQKFWRVAPPVNPEVVQAAILTVRSAFAINPTKRAGRAAFTSGFEAALLVFGLTKAPVVCATYSVTLVAVGPKPDQVIAVLMSTLGVTYDVAKGYTNSTPVVLKEKEKISKEEAEAIKAQLVEAGATVEVK